MATNRRRGVFALTDDEFERLAQASANPRLTKTAAAFNTMLAACLGVDPAPISIESMKFLTTFDDAMRAACEADGLEIRTKS